VQKTDADLQDPLINAAQRPGFRFPEDFEGFMAEEIIAGVELANGGQQGRRRGLVTSVPWGSGHGFSSLRGGARPFLLNSISGFGRAGGVPILGRWGWKGFLRAH
jgi:hypothetical protein